MGSRKGPAALESDLAGLKTVGSLVGRGLLADLCPAQPCWEPFSIIRT